MLYRFQAVFPPIIRISNCAHSIWYMSSLLAATASVGELAVQCHMFLSWARLIQSMPTHRTSWRSILLLPSHLRLGLPSVSFPQFSAPKQYIRLSSHPFALHAPPISFFSITRTKLGEEYRLLSSTLCNFLHYPVTSSLLGPNILLNTLFSNTLSLLSKPFA